MFFCLPYPLNAGLFILPFFVIRTGAFFCWKMSTTDSGVVKSFYTFCKLKPEDYWLSWPLIFISELIWAAIVLFPYYPAFG